MQNFVMLTRISPDTAHSPEELEELESKVADRIRKECPEIHWTQNLTLMGPWDYLDTFEAPDIETAAKVSALVRTYGHAQTEVWAATEWDRFKEKMHEGQKGNA
jgi:uncharacterized protein with GYD domain